MVDDARANSEQVGGATRPEASDLLELYDRALPQVYGYLLPRCGVASLAEDLTADTFLTAVRAVKDATVADLTVGWLIGVARHKLVDHWRRSAREESKLALVDAGGEAVADDPAPLVIERERVHEVLTHLGPHHRAALTLRYLDGLPVRQVADHLDRTPDATEALLVRARAAFRRRYAATDTEGRGA